MTHATYEWPFRQDDSAWKNDTMWERSAVMNTHMSGNGASEEAASELVREFEEGNTIGNEGCLITCLAMILHRLDLPTRQSSWTPKSVNTLARDGLYYSDAGLSNVPLYADLVSELSNGEVQLCAKEAYLSGEPNWPPNFASDSWLVRGYRAMIPDQRRHFMLMLKIGTYDDSVASHYVLLSPEQPGSLDEDDPEILDPAMPTGAHKHWSIADSAKQIRKDAMIRREWDEAGIELLQLCGVWLFGHWRSKSDRMLMEPFVKALAGQLEAK